MSHTQVTVADQVVEEGLGEAGDGVPPPHLSPKPPPPPTTTAGGDEGREKESSIGESSGKGSSSFAAFSDSTYGANGAESGRSGIKSWISASAAALHRLSFSVITHRQPVGLSVGVGVVELVQLMLIPIALVVSLGATGIGSGIGVGSSGSGWGLWANIMRYPFDPTPQATAIGTSYGAGVTSGIVWAMVGCAVVYWITLSVEWMMTRSGALPHEKVLTILKWMSTALRVLPLPMICMSISLLKCSEGAAGHSLSSFVNQTATTTTTMIASSMGTPIDQGGEGPRNTQETQQCLIDIGHAATVSAIGMAVVVLTTGYNAVFQVDFLPSLDSMAQSHSRLSGMLFVGKVVLAVLMLLQPVSPALRAFLMTVVMATLAGLHWAFMPFFKTKWNMMYTGALCFGTWASLIAFIAGIVARYDDDFNTNDKLNGNGGGIASESIASGLLAVQLVGGVAFGIGMGVVGVKMRFKWLEKKLRAGTSSIKRVCDVDMLLRPCYNCKPFPNILFNEKAQELLARFNEKFGTSSFVHLVGAAFALECQHDPRGMIVQGKMGKRQDTYPDTKFLLNCMIQLGHDIIDEEAGGKREIETLLDSAARHHKVAKNLCAKFWSDLGKGVSGGSGESNLSSIDNSTTWQLMRNIHEHDSKAYNTLMALLRRYPTNIRILRQYARFMDEVRNDKEASSRAFMLADQFEEDCNSKNKKRKKHNHEVGAGARAVTLAPGVQSPKMSPTNAGSTSASSTFQDDSDSASISSASGLQQGDETVKLRSYRRRFETSKSYAAIRLNWFFFIAMAIIMGLILAEYLAATSALDLFERHLNVVSATGGTRVATLEGLFYARRREYDQCLEEDGGSCQNILAAATTLESKVTAMFQESKITEAISDIWSESSTEMKYYVPGLNASDVNQGVFYVDKTKPLWDAALTFVNEFHYLCLPNDVWYNSSDLAAVSAGTQVPLRLTPHMRLLMDSPWSMLGQMERISGQFQDMINKDVSNVRAISLGLFVSRVGIAGIAFALLLVWGFRSVGVEHRAAAAFFQDIPRSTISNIRDKLLADGDETAVHEVTSATSGFKLSTSTNSAIQVFLSFLTLLGLGAAMFGLIMAFCGSYSNVGTMINADGYRRHHVISTKFLAQEYAVKDPYGDPLNTTFWRLTDNLQILKTVDEMIKYGDSATGITDYLRSDGKLYDLWYDRPCPEELNLTACNGLGQLLRRYIDSINLFVGAPLADTTTNNTNLVNAIRYEPFTTRWLEEGVATLFSEVLDAAHQLYSNLQIILAISFVTTAGLWLFMRFTVNRVANETERLIKMLVFVPIADLESISSIREYIESETDITKATKGDGGNNGSGGSGSGGRTQEQQTKNLLDGCEDAVLVCGPLLTVEIVNPAAEKLSGFVAQDLLGQPISAVVPEQMGKNSKFLSRLKKSASFAVGGESETEKNRKAREITLQTKSGHRIQALVTISKSTVNNRTSQALFIRDITPQKEHEKKLLQQQKLAEQFLSNIIPKTLVKQLADRQASGGNMIIAQTFEEVTVMFADIVQFTNMSSGMSPEAVVRVLNDLVSEWDKLALELGVEKIKTIGDCYMACTGVPIAFADHADVMMEFVIGMQQTLASWNTQHPQGPQIRLRIGVHTGPVVAGVLGIHKMAYDLWGETVATAERMESSGFPDRIQLSESTFRKVKGHGWHFESRGMVQVKGRGEMAGYLFVPDAVQDRVQTPDNVAVRHSLDSFKLSNNGAPSGTGPAMPSKSPLTISTPSIELEKDEFGDLAAVAADSSSQQTPSLRPLTQQDSGRSRAKYTGPTALTTSHAVADEIATLDDSIPQLLGTASNDPSGSAI